MSLAGFEIFDELTAIGIAAMAGLFFGSYFVKGAIGMGALSPAVLFGTMLLGPHHAVLLAVLTNAASQLQFLPQGLRHGDWRIARQVMLGNFAGSIIGVWIFGQISSAWLTLLLGLTLGLVLIADVTRALERLAVHVDLQSPKFMLPFSALSGIVSGVTGAGGLFFVAIYVKHLAPSPQAYRGTIILLSMLVVLWRTGVLTVSGLIDVQLLLEGLVLLPAIVLGGIAGTWFYRRLSVKGFFLFFQIIILLGAVNLTLRGLWELF
jgi:uncharacterized membrane protein YfcA